MEELRAKLNHLRALALSEDTPSNAGLGLQKGNRLASLGQRARGRKSRNSRAENECVEYWWSHAVRLCGIAKVKPTHHVDLWWMGKVGEASYLGGGDVAI